MPTRSTSAGPTSRVWYLPTRERILEPTLTPRPWATWTASPPYNGSLPAAPTAVVRPLRRRSTSDA